MSFVTPPLTWLEPGQDFPPVSQSWGADSSAPGLLAAGGVLNVDSLRRAYSHGIFPWFSEGQPILWWSPDPRMVLNPAQFKLHLSLQKSLQKFHRSTDCEIRIDTAFEEVIHACAASARKGQGGTWIVEEMIAAYGSLHRAGLAHSVETWRNGQLVGGLYCVALGGAVFGESMFSRTTDSSKIALAALVCFCRHHGIQQIDCQQNTKHLASLGAQEISREQFLVGVHAGILQASPMWTFDSLYWQEILPHATTSP
jgi:leucyl/phenylalanyl-tRNA--protein transferase